jgi:hypothetical protein
MELIAVIPVIFLVAAVLAWVTKIDLAYLFAPAIFFIVIWELFFGFLGYLNLGMEYLVVFICITIVVLSFSSLDFRSHILKSSYAPSTFAFVTFSLISLYKSKDWLFSIWDEFSHWGLFTKAMYEYGALVPATPVDVWNAKYPPGITLFQYFVLDFNTGWQEGLLFWSMHLLVFSIIISVLAGCTYEYRAEVLFKLFISLVAASTFLNSFDTIYQDPVLALAFGFLIVIAIKASYQMGKWSVVLTLTAVFVTLIKPVGIYFAVSAILLNIAAIILSEKRKSVAYFYPSLVALTTSIIVWAVWRYYALNFGVSNSGYSDAVPSGFNSVTNQQEVVSNFIKAFFQIDVRPSYSLPMSSFIWTILCVVFYLIWVSLNGYQNRKRNIFIGITLLLTTVGYFAVILLSYLTVFAPGEATGLASYDRYIGTWFQGVLFAIVVLILLEFSMARYFDSDAILELRPKSLKSRKQLSLFLVAFVGITMLSSIHNYMNMLNVSKTQGSEVRKPFVPVVKAIKNANMPMQSKVYIVAQHTVGFEYFVLRYEMVGMKFGQVPWSMGTPFGDTDIWTDTTWDNKKWSNSLLGFDYVVLYKTTEAFNTEFGSLFESGVVETNAVYLVVKDGTKVSLSRIS